MKEPPVDYDFDKQAEILDEDTLWDDFYGSDRSKNKSPQQIVKEQISRLNSDQRAAFDLITTSIEKADSEKRMFFVEGAGGCGISIFF